MNGIFWILGDPPVPLAIVLCPRGGKGLQRELQKLKQGCIETLVSLLEEKEAQWLELGDERQVAEKVGLQFLSHPIPDTHIPQDVPAFNNFVRDLATRVQNGEHLGIHCRGSIGRATVTAACTLVHLGWNADRALEAIEQTRGYSVPDTLEQQAWILAYEA